MGAGAIAHLTRSDRAARRNAALDRQEEQEDGKRGDDRGRHHRPPIDAVIPEILIEPEGQRFQFGLGQEGQRKQILGPAQQERVSRGGDETRAA